jgi:hypothetical protein
VNNNLAESFNSWIRKIKGLYLVDMLDKIRHMLMIKFELRQRIEGSEKVTRGVNGSQTKFLAETWPIS